MTIATRTVVRGSRRATLRGTAIVPSSTRDGPRVGICRMPAQALGGEPVTTVWQQRPPRWQGTRSAWGVLRVTAWSSTTTSSSSGPDSAGPSPRCGSPRRATGSRLRGGAPLRGRGLRPDQLGRAPLPLGAAPRPLRRPAHPPAARLPRPRRRGVGGGSLNYANTLYVPPAPFFRDRQWGTSPTGRPSSRRTTRPRSACSA